jgi:hypothetical protein
VYALTHGEEVFIPPVHAKFLAGLDADTTTHFPNDVEEHIVDLRNSRYLLYAT